MPHVLLCGQLTRAWCVTVSVWTIDTCLTCYCQCVDNWHVPPVLLSVCGQFTHASCVTVSLWTIDTCLVCYCVCVDN